MTEPDVRRSEEVLEAARRRGVQPALLRAWGDVGRARLAAGDLDGAESALRNAVQQARAWEDPASLGGALLWLARVLARRGRPDRALLAYTEACGHLARAGAPEAEEAGRELRALGAAPPSR